jgi:hypothetical protein
LKKNGLKLNAPESTSGRKRIRYENETEDSVDVVIEKKDGKQ